MLYGLLLADLIGDDGETLGVKGDYVELSDRTRLWLLGRGAEVRILAERPAGQAVPVPHPLPELTDRRMRGGLEACL